jgi:beta-phosphoglucomutase-like phosphatase (HAD superfamily)
MRELHGKAYRRRAGEIHLERLTIEPLGVPDGVSIITRDQVARAKPDPDLFLAAAGRLNVDITDSVVVGDSVWDLLAARRARAWASACCQAATGRKSWNGPGRIACTRTRPTSCATWTRSGCAPHPRRFDRPFVTRELAETPSG